jgi:Na+-translocating ferredoxin:NAD+ oxidoreductase RnfD subunit
VSSPLTGKGIILYALLAGVLSALFRLYGAGVHGVMLAILVANMIVPLIDRHTMPKRFGLRGGRE